MKNRVLAYHKNSKQIHLENVLFHSTDGKCIIFNFKNNFKKEIGTLRAVTLIEQQGRFEQLSSFEKSAYTNQLSLLRQHLEQNFNYAVPINHQFLSPILLEESILQKQAQQLQSLSYVFPKITYEFHDWKENGKFGTDLYLYQTEVVTMEADLTKQEATTSSANKNQPTNTTNNITTNVQKNTQTNISQSIQTTVPKNVPLKTPTKKPTGILMGGTLKTETVFGNPISKDLIKQIIFSDTLEHTPSYAWDASIQRNGSVMAWVLNGVLHICGDGGVIALSDCKWLFAYYKNVTSIDFANCFYTQNCYNMHGMFTGCSKLTKINLSNFDTKNVKDMDSMFSCCSNLTELNLSSFDTSNVTKMSNMFLCCSNLKKLDISTFHTTNVTSMSSMFNGCHSLTELNVSHLNTKNVKNMGGMFNSCSSLTQLNVSNFDTQNVTDMTGMFLGCSKLTSLNLSNFNTQNVTSMRRMFYGCSNLTSLRLFHFNIRRVTNMEEMFLNCSQLMVLSLPKINLGQSINKNDMLKGCPEQQRLLRDSISDANYFKSYN